MTRLFTVKVVHSVIPHAVHYFRPQHVYECDFAGIHFSRECEADLIKWVRITAVNVYGKTTQVIFLHTERQDND